MSRILVLGGYGGFGARISRRLAGAGHEVLVAGRSLAKAQSYCEHVSGTLPVQVDRDRIADALMQHRPALVVDASGPFQGLHYSVPEACIAAGVHYCDISDGREFVCGIGSLDAAAKEAGVAVIAGASSVPALSGAVVRKLADGLGRVTAVDIAISASNRATAGSSVAQAILGQVGKPLLLWRGQRWVRNHGWQEQFSEQFHVGGVPPIFGRLVAIADVPDLELLPARLAGRPACTFRAGTELGFQNRALRLASWLIRWGLISDLRSLAPALGRLQSLTAAAGTDRSAMIVRLFGFADQQPVERRWTLIADQGDGPEIPTLSVPLVVERILSGAEPAGARDAGQSLCLEAYETAFAGLAIAAETVEIKRPDPPYRQVMGQGFARLPESLRLLHSPNRDAAAIGEATVNGPSNLIARAVRRLMRFPPPGRHNLRVEFSERDGVERWTRSFGRHCFSSEICTGNGQLQERFGPLRFTFDLPVRDNGLEMVMRSWSAFGIRMPLRLAPRSRAREWDEDGTFHFDVPISVPILGGIIHYRGWLHPL